MQQSRIASCSSDQYSRKLETEIFVCPLRTSVQSKQSTRVTVRV